ncbi:MAG: formylglycine-generating enzyme family protein, partial [bacterium]
MLSWADADRYCRARGWRLPTEAEWQRAMSAGAEDHRYPWGDDPRPGGRPRFNHWEGADHHENRAEDGHVHTSPVRAYPPNAWGLYDPVGNVWQFVADWWAADAYARLTPGALDPQGPADGWAKVGRGGSWWCSEGTCEGYGLW